jgi:hypothetical protein
MSIITLTTDFGTSDGYVGTMKGVILSIAPDVTLVDIAHEIAPQNIRQAAYVLHASAPYFPSGTIIGRLTLRGSQPRARHSNSEDSWSARTMGCSLCSWRMSRTPSVAR